MVKWLQGSIRWLRLGTCWAQNTIGPELGLLGDLLNGCHFWCVCWTLGIFHGVGHRETLWGALDPAMLSARHWLPITPQEPSKGPGAWMQPLLTTLTYFLLFSVMASKYHTPFSVCLYAYQPCVCLWSDFHTHLTSLRFPVVPERFLWCLLGTLLTLYFF